MTLRQRSQAVQTISRYVSCHGWKVAYIQLYDSGDVDVKRKCFIILLLFQVTKECYAVVLFPPLVTLERTKLKSNGKS